MKTLLLFLLLTASAIADTYLLRDSATKATILRSTRADGFIPEALDHPGSEVVRIVQNARPAYNAATHKLVATVAETGNNPIVQTRGWDVVALTAPELATLADNAARASKRAAAAATIPTLRQWAIDAANASAAWDSQTTAQRFAATKILMTRMSTFFDRFADLLEAQRIDQGTP